LDSEVLGYTVALGIPPLRAAIAGHYGRAYGLDVAPEDVVVTTGSSGGFLLAFLAAFDVGDRVAMARPGYPCYRNLLTALGCEVVELPCGPETRYQPTVAMLAALLHATAVGELAAQPPLAWADGAAVTVVVAAEGYPGPPRLGDVITGADGEGVLHAGTRRRDDGAVVSAGGRVLSVVGTGADLAEARADAYRRLDGVHLAGSHHRTDIAERAAAGEVAVPAPG
jgi:hypothetical protein